MIFKPGKIYQLPHYLLIIISLVISIVCFRWPLSTFSFGIDPPLHWLFNNLIQGHTQAGRNIVFPHGPLAFVMYPLPGYGLNIWLSVSFHLLLRTFLVYGLIRLAGAKNWFQLAFAISHAYILLSINGILLTWLEVIIVFYLLYFFDGRKIWLLLPLFLLPLALFVKAFIGIVSLSATFVLIIILIYMIIKNQENRSVLFFVLVFPVNALIIWLLLYKSQLGLLDYFKGIKMLAADNSVAVSVYPVNNWLVIGTGILGLIILFITGLKSRLQFIFMLIMLPVLFAIWKYGMARQDYEHTIYLYSIILFTVFVFNILRINFSAFRLLISAIIIVSFFITLKHSKYYEFEKFEVRGISTLAGIATNYGYYADTCNEVSNIKISRNQLDNSLLKIIGDKPTDIYPWDYSYIPVNQLNWRPRRVLQSYASYTRELDELNARHFQSDKAPQFLVWQLRKITKDLNGGLLESIDGRYLLNDEPLTFAELLKRYNFAGKQTGEFPAVILQKRKTALEFDTTKLNSISTTWNTWIDVPSDSKSITTAMVDIKRNATGKFISFLYKDQPIYVYYLTDSGQILVYRVVPQNIAYSLWVNPLLTNPERNLAGRNIKRIMFRCPNPNLMNPLIKVNWQKTNLSNASEGENMQKTLYHFFGMTDLPKPSTDIYSSNYSFSDSVSYWRTPEVSTLRSEKGNTYQLVKGEGFSTALTLPVDSLSLNGALNYRIFSETWFKAPITTKAVLVLSLERNNSVVWYKAIELSNFIHSEGDFNHAINFYDLGDEIKNPDGLALCTYVWNIGTDEVEVDNFRFSIQPW